MRKKNTENVFDRCTPYPVFVAIPDSSLKPRKPDIEQKNVIPEPEVTEGPRLQPFDYDGEVYIGNPGDLAPLPQAEYEEEEPERGDGGEENFVANEDHPRGDVFSEFALPTQFEPWPG